MYSLGGENDAEYLRMVQDVGCTIVQPACFCMIQLQGPALDRRSAADRGHTVQSHGLAVWKGRYVLGQPVSRDQLLDMPVPTSVSLAAFDKGDLLYMRDEDEKRRFMEQQLRDSERSQFRKLQAAESLPSREAPSDLLPRPKDNSLGK